MVISRIATLKNLIELLVPGQIETGFVILGKFWSRFDLRQYRNRKFLGDDQGCLANRQSMDSTVRLLLSEKSFLLTHCPQIYIRKEISRPGFLDVNR